jgi:hypothetical protein
MQRQLAVISAVSCILPSSGRAQAPASADLWRVAATALAAPAPLTPGPTGLLWNPAAPAPGSTVGLEIIQTDASVGLSGLSAAGQALVRRRVVLGLVVGRMQVRDLVRTTTSPNSEVGSIPVHEQFIGGKVGVRGDWFEIATLLRYHDERFDALEETGFTLDWGAYAEPWSMVRFAVSTHFFPLDFSKQPTTDYFFAGEVEPLLGTLLRDSQWRVLARYGLTVRPAFGPDHMISAGMRFNDQLSVDISMTRESGYASGAWRPAVSFSLRIGRYTIGAARGSGVNDVDGMYRVGMNVRLK